MGLVLRRHAKAADAGVQRVRQREIDDARLAAEIDGRLGAAIGQLLEAAAAPAGQHIGHGIAGQRLGSLRGLHHIYPPRSDSGTSSSMIVASGGSSIVADARPPSPGCAASTIPPLPLP